MADPRDPFRHPSEPVPYRSVSQVKQYLAELGGCAYQYYLQRRVRAWQRPAAWLAHGVAVHAAVEAWEKSGRTLPLNQVHRVFTDSYVAGIDEECRSTPNFDVWFSSGPYEGEEDVERRWRVGIEQVGKYVDYYRNNPTETPWVTPQGQLAIEEEFDVRFGRVRMRGFIDGVIDVAPVVLKTRTRPGARRVRDVKSGANPGDSFQLAIYAGALARKYPEAERIVEGDYWMGKRGGPTKAYDLTVYSDEQLVDIIGRADAGIKAEDFPSNPDPERCFRCPVARACRFAEA